MYFYILCLKEAIQTVLVSGPQRLNLNLKWVPKGFVLGRVLLAHEFPVTHCMGQSNPETLQWPQPSLYSERPRHTRLLEHLASTPSHCPITKEESPGNCDLL